MGRRVPPAARAALPDPVQEAEWAECQPELLPAPAKSGLLSTPTTLEEAAEKLRAVMDALG